MSRWRMDAYSCTNTDYGSTRNESSVSRVAASSHPRHDPRIAGLSMTFSLSLSVVFSLLTLRAIRDPAMYPYRAMCRSASIMLFHRSRHVPGTAVLYRLRSIPLDRRHAGARRETVRHDARHARAAVCDVMGVVRVYEARY